jgi:hypothetical protein
MMRGGETMYASWHTGSSWDACCMRVLNDNGAIGGPPAQLLALQAAYPEQVGSACLRDLSLSALSPLPLSA